MQHKAARHSDLGGSPMRLTRIPPHSRQCLTVVRALAEPDIGPMNHRLRRGVSIISAAAVVLLAATARAGAETTMVIAAVGSITDVFNNIKNWLTGLLIALATLMLTYGAVRYLAAGGEPGELEKAKQALKNAGKGYLLAVLAPVVVEILRQFVGA
jgi:hypothetical protein